MNAILPFVAKRYLRGQRRHRFGGLVGLFSFFALLIGVASLILVLSIMNGFNTELTGRFLEVLPHATVFAEQGVSADTEGDAPAELMAHPEVLAVSPTMEDFVLLTYRGNQLAIGLTAVDPVLDLAVVDMEPSVALGDWQDFVGQEYGIAIGMQAANVLGLDIGDTVRVNFARVRVLPTGLYDGF